MISLFEISEFSKKDLRKHTDNESDGSIALDIYAKLSPFHERITRSILKELQADTLTNDKLLRTSLLLVALPEFLFTKIGEIANTLNYKKGKDDEITRINKELNINIKKEQINYFNNAQSTECKCSWNIGDTSDISRILMCHGLSPIKDDSILLLADIGRLSRASLALNIEITAMLADTSG